MPLRDCAWEGILVHASALPANLLEILLVKCCKNYSILIDRDNARCKYMLNFGETTEDSPSSFLVFYNIYPADA